MCGSEPFFQRVHNQTRLACALLDHLIGAHEQRQRDREAEGLRGLGVHDQLELRGLLDRQIGWFGAPEDLDHDDRSLTPQVGETLISCSTTRGRARGNRRVGRNAALV